MKSSCSELVAPILALKPRIKVLIVDDSAVARNLLARMLASDPGMEVVGTACDAYMARDKIKKLNPDVLTLDVEMPKMDGITFLANLMRLHPMPVVMVSTLTEKGASVTMEALEYGAVDFVPKPRIDISHTFEHYAREIIAKVRIAATARVRQYRPPVPAVQMKQAVSAAAGIAQRYSIDEVLPVTPRARHFRTTDKLIAIGASTGGTEAIRRILQDMPRDAPGIVVAQHIPASFSKAFAQRLDSHCTIMVKEAENGEQIVAGHAYIAPGDRHLMVVRDGARWRCRLSDDVPVNRHKPSVDVLFRSVCHSAGPNAVGILLTGMGKDGAQGLKDMNEAGAHTMAQDEASSVVWGMPGAAVDMGATDEVLPVDRIADRLISLLQNDPG